MSLSGLTRKNMASCPPPKKDLNTQAVDNFCEYLKIASVHPNIDYGACVEFLEKQADSLDLPIRIHNVVPKKPVVIITWIGTDPTLPSILLNSHMDVVPVYEDKWKYKPFSAHIDEQKNIYARGTQDMKCVGIQYLEAVRRLKQQGVDLKRTVHISFAPDAEIGSRDGMKQFVQSKAFQDLNVGVGLDEGLASPTEEFIVYFGERCRRQFHIHCPGESGHGFTLLEKTAAEKVTYILYKLNEFRNEQIQKLKDDTTLDLADVTTINVTQMRGGVEINVIPPEFVLSFDCRIPPSTDIKKWEQTVNQWCKDAGPHVWIEFEVKEPSVTPTKLDDSNIYWVAFKEATDKLGLNIKPQICPFATDIRFIRILGIPGIGFSPMNNTPVLLHNHDEYLNVDVFLKGIEIYSNIILSIGNKTE